GFVFRARTWISANLVSFPTTRTASTPSSRDNLDCKAVRSIGGGYNRSPSPSGTTEASGSTDEVIEPMYLLSATPLTATFVQVCPLGRRSLRLPDRRR